VVEAVHSPSKLQLLGTAMNRRQQEVKMSDLSQAERTYSFILKCLIETGQAPFYTEIAADLGVSLEEGRKALHALLKLGTAAWVYPNTDYIVSFSPFSNLPTQYRITIDGYQKWFGQ
jgi:hypothetical protein